MLLLVGMKRVIELKRKTVSLKDLKQIIKTKLQLSAAENKGSDAFGSRLIRREENCAD